MSDQKNRPHDTAFKQQRLKAWQPILTPRWVIGSFFIIGIIFIPIGIALKAEADKAFESVVVYESTSIHASGSPCSITTQNQGYNSITAGTPFDATSCTVKFTITQDIPAKTSLQLYYQLSNFFQNHRRYVKSRSDDQLRNTLVMPATGIPSALQTACDPSTSLQNSTTGLVYWPCGLIAQSYFNDGIILKSYNGVQVNPQTGVVPGSDVQLNTTGVAWPSDMDQKFYNPTGSNSNYARFEYVWQKYDQMNCYSQTTNTFTSCNTYGDLLGKPDATGSGCATCPAGSYPVYQGGIQPPGGSSSLTASNINTPATNQKTPYGVRSESFVVWMRTAGLPEFRKLYAYVTPPSGGFKKGDVLEIMVVPNFEVISFGGTKALVLSTVTSMGGKNDVLGIAYVSVGGVCWALALAFMIKHIISPRKLGDTKYIVWRQRGT